MLEGIVLGTIQGITEWLPISSEAAVVLVKVNFFGGQGSVSELIEYTLFLHLGTFLAAAWYLREDVFALIKIVLYPRGIFRATLAGQDEIGQLFRFLFIATVVSGAIGFFLLEVIVPSLEQQIAISSKAITLGIGALLLGTAYMQWQAKRKKKARQRGVMDLQNKDGVLLGILQGFSVLPGFSRSGLTISALLLRSYNETTALRVSFLMSLPVVLGGNIFLQAKEGITLNISMALGLVCSFAFGILTIHFLFRFARKVNFAYFVFVFGILTIISAFF